MHPNVTSSTGGTCRISGRHLNGSETGSRLFSWRTPCAALLIAPFICTAAAAAADTPAIQAARKALLAGEPQQAVATLKAATQARPTDSALRPELAQALLESGSVAEALEVALQASGAPAADPSAAQALGLVRAARYEADEALRVIDETLTSDPGDASLLAAKGRVLWQLKRTRSAIEALEQAGRDPALAAEAQYWLGRIFFFKGWEAEGAFPGWHDEPAYRARAVAAFRAAAAASPSWFRPWVGLAEALLRSERPAEALAAFNSAAQRAPRAGAARVGRWKALQTLRRADEIWPEIAAAAKDAEDPRLLGAAREGYALLGENARAEAVVALLLGRFPTSDAAEAVQADRLEAARRDKQHARVTEQARAFIERFPYSPRLPGVYDALMEAYQASPSAPADLVAAAIDARIKCLHDPGAYLTGAALLAGRGLMPERVIRLAEESIPAAETFVRENLGSYKLDDKARGTVARLRASAIDLVGWAHFLQKDVTTAAAKLAEAERLSHGQDMVNQFHLGELARATGALDRARDHYLNVLSLRGGPEPLRAAARQVLGDIHARLGNARAEFDASLQAELDRRRELRRTELVHSMVDRPAPALKLVDVTGSQVDLAALRGKVILLNFFTSW